MRGPYRARLQPPETYERFWRLLERRRNRLRKLPVMGALAAFVPALAVTATFATTKAPAVEPAVLQKAMAEPWGLVITNESVAPWIGTRPAGGAPPDAKSLVGAGKLQALLEERAPALRSCYRDAWPEDLQGDLVVSIAIRDGNRHAILISGKRSLRRALGSCIESEIDEIAFPPVSDVASADFPIRFRR